MKELKKLALEQASKMAGELDSECISLSNKLGLNKEEFSADKHTYPLAHKARDIQRWIDAVIGDD